MEAGRLPGACRGGRGTVWAVVLSSPWLCGRRAEAGYAGSHVHSSRHHCFRSRFSGLGRGAERVGARAHNPLRLPACHFPVWQDQAAGPRARERPAQTASTARTLSLTALLAGAGPRGSRMPHEGAGSSCSRSRGASAGSPYVLRPKHQLSAQIPRETHGCRFRVKTCLLLPHWPQYVMWRSPQGRGLPRGMDVG